MILKLSSTGLNQQNPASLTAAGFSGGKSEQFRYLSRRRRTRKKVAATASRRKRADEPSGPFCEKGGAAARAIDFFCKKKSEQAKLTPTWYTIGGSNPGHPD